MKKNLKVIRFFMFLLSNRAFVPFFRNRMLLQSKFNQHNGILGVMLFVRRNIKYGNDVFYTAFVFQDSKEGRDYWVKLSDKWVATN